VPSKKPPTTPPAPGAIADDFTSQDISGHLAATLQLRVNAEAQWPGLVSLQESDRSGNVGKLVARLAPALRALFGALTPVAGEAAAVSATKNKLAAVFNAALGDADQGKDPGVFEVDLMVRRLDRIEAQQQIVAKLGALQKAFADDIINTGELVVGPGLKAMDIAKSVSGNADFHSLLAPVINALGDLTKAARAGLAAARAAAKQQAAAPGAGSATSGGANK
jgi:hypothetical protein